MILKTTITEKRKVEVNIELPYFCKNKDAYYKVITEKDSVRVQVVEGYKCITRSSPWLWTSEIAECTPCTEYEFISAMEETGILLHCPFNKIV